MTAELASVTQLPLRRGDRRSDQLLDALLVRAAAGDLDAFLAFYDATVHLVWRLELGRYRSAELAAAASRRRFVQAWVHADEHAASSLSPRAWLLSLPAIRDGRSS
ncbi:MAG: hypothetical protein ACJ72D_15345 [Marmoricola sp.]